jgi:hypothetical protein
VINTNSGRLTTKVSGRNSKLFSTAVIVYCFILWHVVPFLGNARNTRTQQQKSYLKKCFLCGPRHAQCWATGRLTRIVTCDTYFPWGPTRIYIPGNGVTTEAEESPFLRPIVETRYQARTSEGRFRRRIVNYCKLFVLKSDCKRRVNKSNYPVQNPLLLVTTLNMLHY